LDLDPSGQVHPFDHLFSLHFLPCFLLDGWSGCFSVSSTLHLENWTALFLLSVCVCVRYTRSSGTDSRGDMTPAFARSFYYILFLSRSTQFWRHHVFLSLLCYIYPHSLPLVLKDILYFYSSSDSLQSPEWTGLILLDFSCIWTSLERCHQNPWVSAMCYCIEPIGPRPPPGQE